MKRIVVFFLLLIVLILAMLLALLGVETIPTNPIGWLLLLVGVAFIAGTIIVFSNRKERFWESALTGAAMHEERGDRSYWFITVGMIAAFFLSPIEYIYLSTNLPCDARVSSFGFSLVTLGVVLFVWARRTLGLNYSRYVPAEKLQKLVKSGPYRFIHHPTYAGYLFMALGISLGYSSLAGLLSILALLLPGLVNRMNVEEKLLAEHFGEAYRQYASTVKRLIPGVW